MTDTDRLMDLDDRELDDLIGLMDIALDGGGGAGLLLMGGHPFRYLSNEGLLMLWEEAVIERELRR